MLVIEAKKVQEDYGNLYLLNIVNVPLFTLIFGKLTNVFYLQNVITLLEKKQAKPHILKDLTVFSDNGLRVSLEKHCLSQNLWKTILELFDILFMIITKKSIYLLKNNLKIK